MMMKNYFFAVLSIFLLAGCGDKDGTRTTGTTTEADALPYEIRMTLEHNPNAFTQGLVFDNDKIIESTGGDSSWIATYNIASGKYERKVTLDAAYFGEGITVFDGKLYQLTWKSKKGFVYDAATFKKIGEFAYNFEGWGITHDQQHLIISDGTDKLHYFDPSTLKEVATKSVKNHHRKTSALNELELIDGYIYANQWQTNYMLKIDTGSAEVVQEIDLGYLAKEIARTSPEADVLNGIAYNPNTQEVYVTGKLWPRLYVLRLKE